MSAARVPRGVLLTALLCALVVAAALGGAAVLRQRASAAASAPETTPTTTGPAPSTTGGVGPDGCRPGEACQVMGSTTLGSTSIDLVVDPGGSSGRVRIGGPTTSQVVEIAVTGSAVKLGQDSLTCYAAGISACLVRGTGESGVAGQVIAGRSGKWSPVNRSFFSAAGYLSLANVNGDTAPEVLAAQCADACPRAYVQVFDLGGTEQGCTKAYAKVEQLPGYPQVAVTSAALRPCP